MWALLDDTATQITLVTSVLTMTAVAVLIYFIQHRMRKDAHVHEVLGLLASHSEQWATAKDYFEAALKLLPEKAHAKVRLYRQLGSVWRSLGDDHRALQYFSQAEALATH